MGEMESALIHIYAGRSLNEKQSVKVTQQRFAADVVVVL